MLTILSIYNFHINNLLVFFLYLFAFKQLWLFNHLYCIYKRLIN